MTQLPTAPERMSYDDVSIVFERLTDGDLQRGFVPGYHFKIFNEESQEVGHLNVRVGDTEHVRLAAGHIGFEIAEQHKTNLLKGLDAIGQTLELNDKITAFENNLPEWQKA